MKKILWLDTETTGLNPKKHGLREIGYIMVIDGQVVKKDVLYIDPRTYKKGTEIDIRALELSNITIDDFYYYSDSNCVFDDFRVILDKYSKGEKFILAGFNVKFDNDFLREWFYDNNAGVDFKDYFHYKVIDVFPLVITLKHLGFIDTVDDKLKTVCEHFNIPIDAHNALSDIEATKNLYELISDRFINDKEVFKQKEFDYRTHCQNVLSAARLEADEQADRLAELEKVILDYYLGKGYQIGVGEWCFDIDMTASYKSKLLRVIFWENKMIDKIVYISNKCETTKEMWDKAIKHFSLNTEPLQEDTKPELDDTSHIYKVVGYESDGRE